MLSSDSMQIPFPASARPHTHLCWLDTRHTFDFGARACPSRSHFRALRVLNEERVAPGEGFDAHPHEDVEILTWVLSGALEHRDSLGGHETLRPGVLQRLSAGTGVVHSEQNASPDEPLHFLQFWLAPRRTGVAPSLENKVFRECDRRGRLRLLAAPDGRDGALLLEQDALVLAATLGCGETVVHLLAPGRHGFVYVARGSLAANGRRAGAGDGLAFCAEERIVLTAGHAAEVFVLDLG
jgi:redox-sensitive bicupin YhaK (pirin superfamily)